jgi:uncharacterized protein (TIGR02757 family)
LTKKDGPEKQLRLKDIPADIKEFLEEKASQYNNPVFIESDPVSVPHGYTSKEDIEISGFLTAVIAWGNRAVIIRNARRLMELMDNAPYDFIRNHTTADLGRFSSFVHRTFNGDDAGYFIRALKHIYLEKGGLERIFSLHTTETSTQNAIHEFRKEFFSLDHPQRTTRHISDPAKGSAAKRINMFLRWVVRRDNRGVDFGLWRSISPARLSCPVDIHSGNVARKLGLITRKQNDALALKELDTRLREMDANDPVKYDFALFGLGVFEKF